MDLKCEVIKSEQALKPALNLIFYHFNPSLYGIFRLHSLYGGGGARSPPPQSNSGI